MNKKLFASKYFNDDSGRMLITSLKTNSKYVVEPIHNNKTQVWTYLDFTKDSIEELFKNKPKSVINEKNLKSTIENGFINVMNLPIKYDVYTWLEKFEELSGQTGKFILINPEDLINKELLTNLNLKVANE